VASSKEELFLLIRRDSWQQGLSVRALARKYRVHRRLVREALCSTVPAPRRTPRRRSPRLEPYKKTIDQWLLDDLDAPPKQRHTVKRILTRLQQEAGADIAYSTVWDYVHRRRQEIAEAAGATPAAGFVIRHNQPGMDAEVDFGEAWVDLAGERTKCFVFAFRLAYSGKAVHRITASDFDYTANRNVTPALINNLATCEWVKKGEPLCLIGDSGTGKSHLLIGLGSAAAMSGFRVRYALAAKLVNCRSRKPTQHAELPKPSPRSPRRGRSTQPPHPVGSRPARTPVHESGPC
jgi:transposase